MTSSSQLHVEMSPGTELGLRGAVQGSTWDHSNLPQAQVLPRRGPEGCLIWLAWWGLEPGHQEDGGPPAGKGLCSGKAEEGYKQALRLHLEKGHSHLRVLTSSATGRPDAQHLVGSQGRLQGLLDHFWKHTEPCSHVRARCEMPHCSLLLEWDRVGRPRQPSLCTPTFFPDICHVLGCSGALGGLGGEWLGCCQDVPPGDWVDKLGSSVLGSGHSLCQATEAASAVCS